MSITSKTDVPITYIPYETPMTNDVLIGASAAAASYALRDKVSPLITLPVLFFGGEWALRNIFKRTSRFSQLYFEEPSLILDSGSYDKNVQLVHNSKLGDHSAMSTYKAPPENYTPPKKWVYRAAALG